MCPCSPSPPPPQTDRALQVNPNNLDVLLSLGVSHTNELDSGEALTYLARWLYNHPNHRAAAEMAGVCEQPALCGAACAALLCFVAAALLACTALMTGVPRHPQCKPSPMHVHAHSHHPPISTSNAGTPSDSSQAASHTLRMFESAATSSPADAELHLALGVLHHLSRRYERAVASFQRALELRPADYSLWNKLGATLANFSHSGDAIGAYQVRRGAVERARSDICWGELWRGSAQGGMHSA